MRTFLMLAVREPEPTARLIRASARASATVVLDLEDALWDVTDEEQTSALKAAGRENLVTLAQEHRDLFDRLPIGVRVNRVSGVEGRRDFEALEKAGRFVELECIVLPKLETERDLADCLTAIRVNKLACRSIVPIVETRRALANLDRLLASIREAGIDWVVYGHYDLALDSGWWPITEHFEPAFWGQVEPLIRSIEAAGLGYVHPPYFHSHDDAGFAQILEHLGCVCRREFGVLTIGLRQAATADWVRKGGVMPATAGERPPSDGPLALARRVADAYQVTHRSNTGFALDPRTGEFIPPHVYLAAREYLRQAAYE